MLADEIYKIVKDVPISAWPKYIRKGIPWITNDDVPCTLVCVNKPLSGPISGWGYAPDTHAVQKCVDRTWITIDVRNDMAALLFIGSMTQALINNGCLIDQWNNPKHYRVIYNEIRLSDSVNEEYRDSLLHVLASSCIELFQIKQKEKHA